MSTKQTYKQGLSAHVRWEKIRGDENECGREVIILERNNPPNSEWWRGWFERSDEWRDGLGEQGLTQSPA